MMNATISQPQPADGYCLARSYDQGPFENPLHVFSELCLPSCVYALVWLEFRISGSTAVMEQLLPCCCALRVTEDPSVFG
jgi:hypothetical protein